LKKSWKDPEERNGRRELTVKKGLIDTNIFIDHLRGYEKSTEFLKEKKDQKMIFSAVTETELISGRNCTEKDHRKKILNLLNTWEKKEVTNSIALRAGDLRRNYEVLTPDAIIASTALENDLPVITRNISDFKPIKKLEVRKLYK
jgi:tRNA(fMet)-specific endonuclease VapC